MRGFFPSLLLLTLLLPESYFDDAMPQGILRVKKGYYTTLHSVWGGRRRPCLSRKKMFLLLFFSQEEKVVSLCGRSVTAFACMYYCVQCGGGSV